LICATLLPPPQWRIFRVGGLADAGDPIGDVRSPPMQGAAAMKRREVLALGLSAALGGFAPRQARAQAKYPERPIKLVVPFVPGGVNDTVARLLADRVKTSLGSVYIENQGGAGGAVGGAAVARAAPDGYTILLGGAGTQVLNPIAMSRPPYDPIKDFEAIAILAVSTLTIVVNPKVPVHTLKELIAYAKANPTKLAYGSAGTGSMTHLGGELFKSLAGTPDIVHVPYKGTGASLTDVISGQVPMIVANVTGQILQLNKSGNLRMIAVTGPARLAADPDIPTAVEAGLPGMVALNFTGLFAPARTPQPIVERIAAAARGAMADAELRKNLMEQGLEPYSDSTPERTRRFVEEDIARWTPVIRSIGLKFN
jgi:tripartite-type tricarboxylate transporter receptor subunit TctC